MKQLRHLFGDPYKFLYMVYGMLFTIMLIAVISFIVVGTGRSIQPPLLEVIPAEIRLEDKVCPGDEISQEVQLTYARPAIVDIVSAVFLVEGQSIVLGTEKSISSPAPDAWDHLPLAIKINAPAEPPGNYLAIFAITPKDRANEIAQVNVWFTLSEKCDE